MAHALIVPIVLCGGRGRRLWPLSTPEKPKVFHSLVSPQSLLQDTILRCSGGPFAAQCIVVGAVRHGALIEAQIAEIGGEARLVLEPCSRDSLPAILAGAIAAWHADTESILLLTAADHYIPDTAAFAAAAQSALGSAQEGRIVTFGVKPRNPSENFGYLCPGQMLDDGETCVLDAFREKPNRRMAADLIAQGWLWNSGNFLCRADALLATARQLVPETLQRVEEAFCTDQGKQKAIELNAHSYALVEAASFDRQIMEHMGFAAVRPVAYEWCDLGTWEAVIEVLDA